MSRQKPTRAGANNPAAQRAAVPHATASLTTLLSPARAAASRRNGARSRGPKTPEGKARSALNALKHGLCAGKAVVIGDEDWDMFDALEAALIEELAPKSPMQAVLARRIVLATWRLERVERMEGELLAQNMADTASFGLGLSRDCNGPRAFNTLLRYRSTALAEFWRCRRDLEALQAKAAQEAAQEAAKKAAEAAAAPQPSKPEAPRNLGEARCEAGSAPAWPAPARPAAILSTAAAPAPTVTPGVAAPVRKEQPDEPESRKEPGEAGEPADRANLCDRDPDPASARPRATPLEMPSFAVRTTAGNLASLLAGTALVPPGGPSSD